MIDQHIHTTLSPDAHKSATLEAIVAQAKARGLHAVALTDHVDFDCPTPLFHRLPDPTVLRRQIAQMQPHTDVDVRLGVELGYQPHVIEDMRRWVHATPFDVVLLSVHYVDRLDPYDGTFFQGRSAFEAYDVYFKTLHEAVENVADFDVLTHLDYIARYAPYEHTGFVFGEHKARLKALFEALIAKDKILEVNTNPWRKGLPYAHPHPEILAWYKACGGKRIALGSDAHRPEHVGADFARAITLLKSLGFSHVTEVKKRMYTDIAL